MPIQTLKNFLDQHHVKYVAIRHSEAYTALEVAASAHISGKEMVKTVMAKIDGAMSMIVMPSYEKVDFEQLREITGARSVELATESDFAHLFPGCEIGAMPPFGNLWGMPVYVSETLTADEQIAFNAGTHTELLRMAYADFALLVDPKVLSFA
jgi:Ala-tRNA(Pro) deacylase